MLISKTDNYDQQESAVNSNLPVCPNCGSAKESILEQVPSPASFIISFFCLLYCGIWCIFIIPLVFQSTKIIIKRCYYCNSELEKRNYFQLPNINDQVLQFRFGNCIIVVSRKYAMILLCIIFCLFLCFEYTQENQIKKVEIDFSTDKSWMEFLQFCGKFQFIENGLKARHQFETHFKDKLILWKGIYVQTKSNYDINFPFHYWVYIKMDPTESTEDIPDIILGVNSQQYHIDTFAPLQTGKPIHFEAKFLKLGSEQNFHILELKNLEITSDSVQDIKLIKKFSLNMDQTQQLKKTKLQDSLKRMIHMYEPQKNYNQPKIDQINVVQMGLSLEQIRNIEQDIQQLHQQIELEEQQENQKMLENNQNQISIENNTQEDQNNFDNITQNKIEIEIQNILQEEHKKDNLIENDEIQTNDNQESNQV